MPVDEDKKLLYVKSEHAQGRAEIYGQPEALGLESTWTEQDVS